MARGDLAGRVCTGGELAGGCEGNNCRRNPLGAGSVGLQVCGSTRDILSLSCARWRRPWGLDPLSTVEFGLACVKLGRCRRGFGYFFRHLASALAGCE